MMETDQLHAQIKCWVILFRSHRPKAIGLRTGGKTLAEPFVTQE